MNDLCDRISDAIQHFDEKKQKKYKTDLFLRLCNKVGTEDEEISAMIHVTYLALVELTKDELLNPKNYRRTINELVKKVRTKLGYTSKGTLQSEGTAIGMAIGIAFGAAFSSINPGLIGVGLPIGLAIGVSIGKKKELDALNEGKTY